MGDPLDNSGLFDIPDYDHENDEAFPPLPPPFSPGQAGGDGDPFTGEDGDVSKLADVPAAKKKVVRKPQPKLDARRLTSDRGLPALRTLFDNVHFKGKGHEAEDLRLLMQKMENWAHRLYPKLQFDDFIDKLDKLNGKKEVKASLQRIRLDLPMVSEDFIGRDEEEVEGAPRENHIDPDDDPFGDAGFLHSTPAPPGPFTPAPATPGPFTSAPATPGHSTPAPAAPSLTEDQLRRIQLNKQLAMERRLARMQQHADSSSQPVPPSVSAAEPDISSLPPSSQHNNGDDHMMELDQSNSRADELNDKPQHEDTTQLQQNHGGGDDMELDQSKSRADELNDKPQHDDTSQLQQNHGGGDDMELDQRKSTADDLNNGPQHGGGDEDMEELDQGKSTSADLDEPQHGGSSQPTVSGDSSESPPDPHLLEGDEGSCSPPAPVLRNGCEEDCN